MKRSINQLIVALALLAGIDRAAAQGTLFTYQGRLDISGTPANGYYDMTFRLYNAQTGGSQVGPTLTNSPVIVSNGLFTTTVDFGAVFDGTTYWLHIGVRTNGVGTFNPLSPRQELTPNPYAIAAESVLAGGLDAGTYGNALTLNNPANSFTGNGSGLAALNGSAITTGTISDLRLSPNVALLNRNQTFTGSDTFTSGAGGTKFSITGPGGIDTSLFTGLSLQYSPGQGEGAFMSSFNDGYASLSFYTKAGTGFPIQKEMIIDRWGNVAIDQGNYNNGFLNNGNTNGAGLTFGTGSGEGIASKRTAGGNQYGLDFYTGFANRMTLLNSGNLDLNGNDLFFLGGSSSQGLGYRTSVAGISPSGGQGPFLYGFDAGYLGTVGPEEVSLWWDWHGNVWVSNNLSVASLNMRGEFLVVNGLGNEQAYIGGDGFGNDVQIGSLTSGITAVACYNATDNAYMHLYCSSITIEGGADLAEPFQISSAEKEVPPGAVVVIDDKNPGQLRMSDRPYDSRVAGVVSGANGINAGIQMQQQGLLEGGKNVALTGRVYVRADVSNGAIVPGDMLTTSTTPGRAMKVTDHTRASGAILGKAMTGLSQGEGMVLVLVTLQ